MPGLIHHELTKRVIGAAIEVHRQLGPGLLESVYEQCLVHELAMCSITFRRQVPVSTSYRGHLLPSAFKADLIVGDELLVELKAVDHVLPVHKAQVITYLRLMNLRRGLLINFNIPRLADGIQSILNG